MTQLGIVGTGIISELLLGGLRAAGIPLAAVCDLDRERANRAAVAFGARVFTDYEEMLADTGIDAVMIALPNPMHFEAARRALNAGKHVFCEKPMTLRLADSRALVELVRKSGKVFQVGYMKRFNPAYAALKKSLPALGPVLGASVRLTSQGKPRLEGEPVKAATWHGDAAQAGGGFLVHSGSHLLELLMHLFGLPERAFGEVRRDRNGNEYHTDVTFEMKAGFRAHFCLTTTEAQGFSYAGTGWEEIVAVSGMKGRFEAQIADWRGLINPVATLSEPDGHGPKRVLTTGISQWAEELKAFVEGIACGRCLGSTVEEGWRVDYLLEQIRRFERERDVIAFNYEF
jgi:predicted dehydrogenase